MKKIISIICILLLLIATSNIAVNIHFCENEIASIDFFGNTSSCGGTCDTRAALKEKSCCKNFSTLIQTSDASSTHSAFKIQQQSLNFLPVRSTFDSRNNLLAILLEGIQYSNSLQTLSAQPFYILYRSLII